MTFAELIVLGFPLVLLVALVVTVPAKVQYGNTDDGRRYKRLDVPTRTALFELRWFWLISTPPLTASAAWCLLKAIASAMSIGMVSLPAISDEDGRLLVSWPSGWAYFLGSALVLLASLAPVVVPLERENKKLLRFTLAMSALLGYALFLFSSLLSSLLGTLAIIGFLLVGIYGRRASKKFGKPAVIAFTAFVIVVTLLLAFPSAS